MIYSDQSFLDVAVLAGGDSAEREISLQSGRCVAKALSSRGHHVAIFDPTDTEIYSINWREFDACFLALHGGAGEDGQIQVQLEELCIPYTGSGPVACRLAMSKAACKQRFDDAGVPTPPWVVFEAGAAATKAEALAALGAPIVIKPDNQGSSLGVGVASDASSVAECVMKAAAYHSVLVAEPFVQGQEFTVAIKDRQPLPVVQVHHEGGVFEYNHKYNAGGHSVVFAEGQAARRAADVAVEAAQAIGTRGLVRVDVIVDQASRPWVLEVNTLPGMTDTSLAPRAAAAAGIDFALLCEQLVLECLAAVEVSA